MGYFQDYRNANRVKIREQGRKHKRNKRYNITQEQYEQMLREQDGKCAICSQAEVRFNKKTGQIWSLSVDHDHKTNKIRKLLCHSCNVGLGAFKDSAVLLQRASVYLSEEGTRNG